MLPYLVRETCFDSRAARFFFSVIVCFQYVFSVFSVYFQCVFIVFLMCFWCVFSVCLMCFQCVLFRAEREENFFSVFSVFSVYFQCIFSVFSVFRFFGFSRATGNVCRGESLSNGSRGSRGIPEQQGTSPGL